jgi:hypothetical protein
VYTKAEIQEYLNEIRKQVCTKCVERPPGGPPCAPLGKRCGVELHLPLYLEAIHRVDSPLVGPYLEAIHQGVCPGCDLYRSDACPCPLDYLLVLMVEAIETVDRRRTNKMPANSAEEWQETGCGI